MGHLLAVERTSDVMSSAWNSRVLAVSGFILLCFTTYVCSQSDLTRLRRHAGDACILGCAGLSQAGTAACVRQCDCTSLCSQYTGLTWSMCLKTNNCKVPTVQNRSPVIPAIFKRYNFDDIMWPDEFETRSSDEHGGRTRMSRGAERMSRGADSGVTLRKRDKEVGKGIQSQGCSSLCHGFSGADFERCRDVKCAKNKTLVHIQHKRGLI